MGGMGDQRRSTMTLDPAHCYQAVLSRDRRFDGRFFAGVVTTGVYCRPICPVKPAKPQNVRWFACAAAAEAAGFRPCRRCRPETAPGTPAWTGTSAVVSRALRLIAAGALDDGAMEGFASRLGVGTRQLRRLFGTHLGASPMQVARARRVHFARALIDETDLPMAEVAFAAGFGSVRDFNYAVRATFGRSPTELRRARGARSPRADGAGLAVRLPYRPPLDWSGLLAFLAPRATPGVEAVADGVCRRTIAVGDARGTIEGRAPPPSARHSACRVPVPRPSVRSLPRWRAATSCSRPRAASRTPSRDSSPSPASVPGPRSTSRCAPWESPTPSRRATSGSGGRSPTARGRCRRRVSRSWRRRGGPGAPTPHSTSGPAWRANVATRRTGCSEPVTRRSRPRNPRTAKGGERVWWSGVFPGHCDARGDTPPPQRHDARGAPPEPGPVRGGEVASGPPTRP